MHVGLGATVLALLLCSAAAHFSPRLDESSLQSLLQDGQLNAEQLSSAPERVAGYFQLSRKHTDEARMFYWFFEARHNSSTAPLVLWLTGGPGCSGSIAVFEENGPFYLTKDGELKEREYGWDVAANMIFVDQPLNVGFSYSEDPDDRIYTEKQVAADLLDFMHEFLKSRPLFKSRPFFITGESYGGHYVPAVAAHITDSNAKKPENERINLQGAAIGNGLTDPVNQYGSYAQYAVSKGLISRSEAKGIDFTWPACKGGIQMCNAGIPLTCALSMMFCQAMQFMPVLALAGNINIYDIRKECHGPLCYDFSTVDNYLNRPDVREKLGIPSDRQWQECSMDVNGDFQSDWMLSYAPQVSQLLEAGIPVLVYAGDMDLICNLKGQEWWTAALQWSGNAAFNQADQSNWVVDGERAGYVRSANNFTLLAVLDAGHMVPMDQPKRALSMFTSFVRGVSFEQASNSVSAADKSKIILGGATWKFGRANTAMQ